jgi:hypothetical protein
MDIATPVCHGLLLGKIQLGDGMSNLSDEIRAQLRALDLVGFVVAPTQAGPEIARTDMAKSGMSKAGLMKAGIIKSGIMKLGVMKVGIARAR